MKASLVIPALNEGSTLGALVDEILRNHSALIQRIIVVDDGSADASMNAIVPGERVTIVQHPRNEGKARALIDGMQVALADGADRVLTMDGDGQHRPADLPRLMHAADRCHGKVIVGARLADSADIPRARYRANRFANFWIAWASGYAVTDSQSGLRLYPAAILKQVLPYLSPRYPANGNSRRKGFVFESEMLIECGRRGCDTVAVPVPAIYGTARASHFRPVADIVQIVIMVAGHLLRRGMNLPGLVRSLRRPAAWDADSVAGDHQIRRPNEVTAGTRTDGV